jgi:hypothetical protein
VLSQGGRYDLGYAKGLFHHRARLLDTKEVMTTDGIDGLLIETPNGDKTIADDHRG